MTPPRTAARAAFRTNWFLPLNLEALLLEGRSSYLCAVFAGVLWTLSFAPFSFLPAGYLSFALPCLWVAYDLPRRQGLKRALKLMATWSFAAYLTSLYWVSHAVWIAFGQSLVGAVVGGMLTLVGCLFQALYALAALLALTLLLPRTTSSSPLLRVGLFVCTFALAESLRGLLFGGFPWNLAGYAWNTSIWLLQTNALAGIELTSFLATASYALAALAVFYFAQSVLGKASNKPSSKTLSAKKSAQSKVARKHAAYALACALLIPASAAAFGAWRLAGAPPFLGGLRTEQSRVENPFLVRIVQPNITQPKKWRVEDALGNFRRALDLSIRKRPASVTLLLWPETTFPYRLTTPPLATGQTQEYIWDHPWIPSLLQVVPRWFVFGAVRENPNIKAQDKTQDDVAAGYRNSLLLIDVVGNLHGLYDKVRLVPLGEFIPFTNNRFGKKIKTLTSFPSFTHGDASPLLRAGSAFTLEAQICYESIFPNLLPFIAPASLDDAGGGSPDLLFNATNDGWFGRSSGPYQHLAMARVRAVERGLPFFRAANTGVSAVFDPFGREIARLDLGAEGWIDAPLPKKTDRLLMTARFGNGLFWLLWFVVVATCLTCVKRKH